MESGEWKMESDDYLFQSRVSFGFFRLVLLNHAMSYHHFPFSTLHFPFSTFYSISPRLTSHYRKTDTVNLLVYIESVDVGHA